MTTLLTAAVEAEVRSVFQVKLTLLQESISFFACGECAPALPLKSNPPVLTPFRKATLHKIF